jgi:DNA-binding transcriptional LysR family regulator
MRLLRSVLAVADELHFTRAAERIHVSQPVLSRHVHQCEESIGFAVFERNSRHVRMTPAGEVFVAKLRSGFGLIHAAIELGRGTARGDTPELRIAYSPSADASVISEVRRIARHARLGVETAFVSLLSINQIPTLRDGTCHLGILIMPVEDEALRKECLIREPLLAAIPKSHRLARKREIPLRDLDGEPLVWMSRSAHPQMA